MEEDLKQLAHKYYSVHVDHMNSLKIKEINCSEEIPDQESINNALNDLNNRLKIKLKRCGKISSILKNQLLNHHLQVGEKYLIKESDKKLTAVIEFFQSREILDLIESIENDTFPTRQRRAFRGQYLNGMMHVHHGAYASKGYSAIKNCIDYWYYKGKIKPNKLSEFRDLLAESEQNIGARMYQKAIYAKLKNGLTGEWIIYKVHEGINYFLCLAKHDEGDEDIYRDKIYPCIKEFPELENVLSGGIKILEEE